MRCVLVLVATLRVVLCGKYSEYLARQRVVIDRLSTSCEYKRSMLKHDPECSKNITEWRKPEAAGVKQCVRELFVTGCGGTGTHAVHGMVAAMNVMGKAVHEDAQSSPNVLVSWASRDGRWMGLAPQQYARWGTKTMRKPMVTWALKQSRSPCAFKRIAHVVRHPLKVLASSVAFGQCVECWVHVEEFIVPSFSPRARPVEGTSVNSTDLSHRTRASIWANRELSATKKMGGRAWSDSAISALIEGFSLYWLAWNAMIAPVADARYQIETLNYVDLCVLAGLERPRCQRANNDAVAKLQGRPHITHGGDSLKVTWGTLDDIDAELSEEVWKLAQFYGYSREPPEKQAPKTTSPPLQEQTRPALVLNVPAHVPSELPRTPLFPPRLKEDSFASRGAPSPPPQTTTTASRPQSSRPPWEARD